MSAHVHRSREEAISECERELQVRERCYDRWVEEKRLSNVDARDRLERLRAAVHYLQQEPEEVRVTSSGDKTSP